jgi:hypothetical protein
VLAGYDYFFDFGLGLGGRVGFAFLGSPSSENTRPNGDVDGDDEPDYAVPPTANSFLPVHAEARASWRFLSGNMQAGQIRPHVFVSGGVAQVNASVPVTVCDLASEGEGTAECPGRTSVDAYQLTGLSFVGFGGGGQYMFIDNFGVNVELKFMVMFPTTGFVISPTVSPVLAF